MVSAMHPWIVKLKQRLAGFTDDQLRRSFRSMWCVPFKGRRPSQLLIRAIYHREFKIRGIPMPRKEENDASWVVARRARDTSDIV